VLGAVAGALDDDEKIVSADRRHRRVLKAVVELLGDLAQAHGWLRLSRG
jgi:hypothetical protein